MNKIHSGQLFSILFLSGAWQVLCMQGLSDSSQLPAAAIAAAVQMLLCIPMLALSGKQISLTHFIARKKWLGFVYILFFLLWGAYGFSTFRNIAPLLSLPFSGTLTAAVLITLTCLYTCSVGLKATARSAPFVLGIFLLSLAVLVLGAYKRMDATRLQSPSEGILSNAGIYACLGGELAAAWVLLDRTKGNRRRAVWGAVLAKAALACLLGLLCIGTAGRLAGRSEYPFFILTALSQPLREQRADALYLLVCVMLYILHITLQTGVIAHLLAAMYPKLRAAAPLSLLLMILLAWGIAPFGIGILPLLGILLLLTAFLVPLILCITHKGSTFTP